jgi:Domain of unknown function (DUF4352)
MEQRLLVVDPNVSSDGEKTWNGSAWVPHTGTSPARTAARGWSPEQPTSPRGLMVARVVLGLLVLGVLYGITARLGESRAEGSNTTHTVVQDIAIHDTSAPSTITDAPSIAGQVADGVFTFTLADVQTGVDVVGDEYLNDEARGAFTLVTLTVGNRGDVPRAFTAEDITGTDSKGRAAAADSEASRYATDGPAWMDPIEPGSVSTLTVAFDLKSSRSLESVTVHGSAFTDGQTIPLG